LNRSEPHESERPSGDDLGALLVNEHFLKRSTRQILPDHFCRLAKGVQSLPRPNFNHPNEIHSFLRKSRSGTGLDMVNASAGFCAGERGKQAITEEQGEYVPWRTFF
jgi:hypothetical protein